MKADYIMYYGKEMLVFDETITEEHLIGYLGCDLKHVVDPVSLQTVFHFITPFGKHMFSFGDGIIKLGNNDFKVIPKDELPNLRAFIEAYSKQLNHEEVIDCDFGTALTAVQNGYKIRRNGWNGKGMFVVYQQGYVGGITANKQTAEAWGLEEGELFRCEPYLQIKMVNGSHSMWTPSINDLLSKDWEVFK